MKKSTSGATGPITAKNYDQRMQAYGIKMALEDNWPFLSRDPNIPATADEPAWDIYFRDHLKEFPPTYRLYRKGVIRYLNVPEAKPELFDPNYRPAP